MPRGRWILLDRQIRTEFNCRVSIGGAGDEVPRDVSSGSRLGTYPVNQYADAGVQLPAFHVIGQEKQ